MSEDKERERREKMKREYRERNKKRMIENKTKNSNNDIFEDEDTLSVLGLLASPRNERDLKREENLQKYKKERLELKKSIEGTFEITRYSNGKLELRKSTGDVSQIKQNIGKVELRKSAGDISKFKQF